MNDHLAIIEEKNIEIARLRAQLAAAEKERDAYRVDVGSLLPEADAKDWALGEMHIALARAEKAERERDEARAGLTACAAQGWISPKELASLRASADALRRLEEWLRGDKDWRFVAHAYVSDETSKIELRDGRGKGCTHAEYGPTLSAAIAAAVEKAKEARP